MDRLSESLESTQVNSGPKGGLLFPYFLLCLSKEYKWKGLISLLMRVQTVDLSIHVRLKVKLDFREMSHTSAHIYRHTSNLEVQ